MRSTIMNWYRVGVACNDTTMKCNYLMIGEYIAESFEKASEMHLNDVSVKKSKVNDQVMLLAVGQAEVH